jgi:hypothetical protein
MDNTAFLMDVGGQGYEHQQEIRTSSCYYTTKRRKTTHGRVLCSYIVIYVSFVQCFYTKNLLVCGNTWVLSYLKNKKLIL